MELRLRCDRWALELAAVDWEDLPATVRERTLIALFDSMVVAAGGRYAPGVDSMMSGILQSFGPGQIAVPWTDLSLGPAGLSMALSTLIHAWDFDDTHDKATVHTCSIAVPAALAAGMATRASGRDFLAGIVVGVQTLARLSLAIGPQHGIVRTAGLGPIAAAAAAARTMRLAPDHFLCALQLAIASSCAPTTRQVVEDGAVNKRLQPGQAAQAGVTAALLAANGIEGPSGWMCGSYGILDLASDLESAVDTLEVPGWEVAHTALKPYPCCRYTHSSIESALQIGTSDFESAVVHVPRGAAYELVARPFARRGAPIIDAQFSIPWLVAVAFADGRVDLQTMAADRLTDPEVERAASKVVVLQDLEPTDDNMAPAHIEIDTGKEVRRAQVTAAPGSKEAPLGWQDVARKAAACVAVGGYAAETVPAIEESVRNLEHLDCEQLLKTIGDLRKVPS